MIAPIPYLGILEFISGVEENWFTRSEPGKPCDHPIENQEDCEKAAKYFSDACFVVVDDGRPMMTEACSADKSCFYWNPPSRPPSTILSPDLQQVCKRPPVPEEGIS